MTDDERQHLDRVEMERAKCRDELRRERLVVARMMALAEDALIALSHDDLDNARYSLARIVGRRLNEDDG